MAAASENTHKWEEIERKTRMKHGKGKIQT
jgi:hypothetical protein